MPRLNGVAAILAYLGYGRKSRLVWRRLASAHGLPYYRDRENPRRVWARTEELDAWDAGRSVQNGIGRK